MAVLPSATVHQRCGWKAQDYFTDPQVIALCHAIEANDLAGAAAWVDDLGATIDRHAVFMMPQGRTTDELSATTAWLAPECRRAGFHLAPRHHIAWFGPRRGT